MEPKAELKNQVEAILDTESGDTIDVVVQVGTDPYHHKRLRDAASEAISRRRVVRSPRELLPKPFDAEEDSELRRTSVSNLLSVSLSREAVTVTMGSMNILERSRMREGSGLRSLLNSDIVKSSASAMEGTSTSATGTPKPLLAANAVPLRLSRAQLYHLVDSPDLSGINAVHVNRRMQLPTFTRVNTLPEEIEDTLGATWGLRKTNALAAWGRYRAKGRGVKVGILDTGIDADHPDLKHKVLEFAEFDSMGQSIGYAPRDSDEHGTHCAGTIVGGDKSGRAIGMAPRAKLAVALVLDGDNGATDAQILAGIDWALTQKVDVISMSLGGLTLDSEMPPTFTEAILSCWEQGVPVVTAIGNAGHQTTGSPGNDLFALSVGATDNIDRVAGFSGGRTQVITSSDFIDPRFLPLSYTKPDLSAPGVAVTSSVPNREWKTFSGTSMATPHVAGAIAQLLSATSIRSKTKACTDIPHLRPDYRIRRGPWRIWSGPKVWFWSHRCHAFN